MPCPFPGMDPYLESPPFWNDFTPTFLAAIRNVLLPALLPKYDVRIEEYVTATQNELRLHRVQPDVTISAVSDDEDTTSRGLQVEAETPTAVELGDPEIEDMKQRRLVLIHQESGQVVTVMELLSTANKTSGADGLDTYLAKRNSIVAANTHLIEFDLLRGGQRLPMSKALPHGDYYVFVGRADRRPHCEVIAWPLRSPLPKTPVPLLLEDADGVLDLGLWKIYNQSRKVALLTIQKTTACEI